MKPTMHLIFSNGRLFQWFEYEDGKGSWVEVGSNDDNYIPPPLK